MLKLSINNNCKGMSLIELMIAMVIGLLLLGGAMGMFSSNKRIYKEQEMMGRLQENARFAIEILISDIRMAGYTGCANDISEIQNHLNDANNDDNIFAMTNAIEGYESSDTKWEPSDSTDQISTITANTDGITIRYLDPNGISPTTKMPSVSANIEVTSQGEMQVGDIIGVADCDSAEIFEITGFPSTNFIQHNTGATAFTGNATKELQKRYGPDADIIRFLAFRYYISNNADGVPSLFRQSINGTILELIEGVENMQLLYGEDTSGDKIANTFVDAATVSNWDNIVAVRLGLLFRTIDENFYIDPDNATHTILGGTGNGGFTVSNVGDNRRRRIFTTTIQIRNRST